MAPREEKFTWGKGMNMTADFEPIDYGFADSVDPNLFKPDPNATTREERMSYQRSLKTWNESFAEDSWERYDTNEVPDMMDVTPSEIDLTANTTVFLEYVEIVKSTQKARLVEFEGGEKVWLPRSRTYKDENNVIAVEEWLLKKNPGLDNYKRRK